MNKYKERSFAVLMESIFKVVFFPWYVISMYYVRTASSLCRGYCDIFVKVGSAFLFGSCVCVCEIMYVERIPGRWEGIEPMIFRIHRKNRSGIWGLKVSTTT